MKKRRARGDSSIELQLTPMIDVVFLLLIFFMVTAKFVAPERKIPAFAAKEREGAGIALVEEFELHIMKAEGGVVVAGPSREGYSLDSLGLVLKELRDYRDRNLAGGALSPDAGVSIECEDDIRWGAVVKVLDVVREAEIPRIRFE